MKMITFEVTSKEEYSIASLLKDVNDISCRLSIDFENNCITVKNLDNALINNVIDLIDKYYKILSVELDNTSEEEKENVVNSSEEETENVVTSSEKVTKNVVDTSKEISEEVLTSNQNYFTTPFIEDSINKLRESIKWLLQNKPVEEYQITSRIFTLLTEMNMAYSPRNIVTNLHIGDVVDVYFGMHIKGEINGKSVACIVCDIYNGNMIYVVPMTKSADNTEESSKFMDIIAQQDVSYFNDSYKGSTVLLNKAKYVRIERIHSIIGKTRFPFFKKLLETLPKVFDFTDILASKIGKPSVEKTLTEITEKTPEKGSAVEETAILDAIGFAFDKLDTTKTPKSQLEGFLVDIGMNAVDKNMNKILIAAFNTAYNVEKINYENIILGINGEIPSMKETEIKNALKTIFKDWLTKYPKLAERCPKISLMAILKVWQKKFA